MIDDFHEVRTSKAWFELCRLIQGILEAQKLQVVLNPKEKYSIKQQTLRAAALIMPFVLGDNFFGHALANEDVGVQLASAKLLQTVLRKVVEFGQMLDTSPKAAMYASEEKKSIYSSFKGVFLQLSLSLPRELWILRL